mmetsp:Transcript_4871/g.6308  ORF Transcript_4871/g.6308 Transcript_4871/m.6308 type:complete len:382 (+) Transcript_4871:149-1294(+)
MTPSSPSHALTVAAIYVLSGASRPLLMIQVLSAGIADPTCQLYMLFYYIGPAMVTFSLCCPSTNTSSTGTRSSTNSLSASSPEESNSTAGTGTTSNLILKASSIAIIDIMAQAMNYTGSTMAGPTIFAIIYSSVTIWTAFYSNIFLKRKLNLMQWMGIVLVFLGLTITAFDSIKVGENAFHGALLILVGSSMHALTYVLSESIMTEQRLSLQMNCSIQGLVACFIYLLWQLIYTRNHFDLIRIPMKQANTSTTKALVILFSLSLSNLVHATSFFYTLKYYPGGATSAGVMKGLQAVLVFVFSSVVYCRHELLIDAEMCFTWMKFISLVVVVSGVLMFAFGTDGSTTSTRRQHSNNGVISPRDRLPFDANKKGYRQIANIVV